MDNKIPIIQAAHIIAENAERLLKQPDASEFADKLHVLLEQYDHDESLVIRSEIVALLKSEPAVQKKAKEIVDYFAGTDETRFLQERLDATSADIVSLFFKDKDVQDEIAERDDTSFIMQLLEVVAQNFDTKDNAALSAFLSTNQDRLDTDGLAVMHKTLSSLLQENMDNKTLALHLGWLGDRMTDIALSPPWLSQEFAIVAYQSALEMNLKRHTPFQWARIQHNLALIYLNRKQAERADNIEHAIEHFELATSIIHHNSAPLDWAAFIVNLGSAYRYRMNGCKADNVAKAIRLYKKALSVINEGQEPKQWALLMNNLGNAYRQLTNPRDIEPLFTAKDCFEQAIQVATDHKLAELLPVLNDNLYQVTQLLEPYTAINTIQLADELVTLKHALHSKASETGHYQDLALITQAIEHVADNNTLTAANILRDLSEWSTMNVEAMKLTELEKLVRNTNI